MGLLDNLAKRVADNISKSAPIYTPITQAQINQALASYGNTNPMPRDPRLASVPFSPGIPLIPGAINPVNSDGRADPRRYEYQVAQNINVSETRLVPFKTLRAAADQIDILRRCIEVLKNKTMGLEWDITLGTDAVDKIIEETGETNTTRAMQLAKEKFAPEISRLKQFWEMPDNSNGLVFADWLNMLLEDVLVLDAGAIWAQKTVKGDLKALQIIDGATIKPLIDDRGMRPTPPNPAYQQMLYGFPRSEFAATDDSIEADGEFSSEELTYLVRNRRSMSVYGFSPVERSLALADIYLRRQQWLRAEYTDGVIPELILESDGNYTPDQLRAYENVLNDALAGQTEQRKRASILPQGLHPISMDGYGEKFKDTLDDYLVTAICGHFGVQPSEIGMTPKSGLGGVGHQAGQAQSSEVIGLIPLSQWLGKMLTQISYQALGMPRELEFKFMASDRTDAMAEAQANDVKRKNGELTLNEARSKEGLSLIDSPIADQPIIFTGSGAFVVTSDGIKPFAPEQDPSQAPEDTKPTAEDATPTKDQPANNIKKFNENHDEQGRFSSNDSGAPTTPQDMREAAHTAIQDAVTSIQTARLSNPDATGTYANQFREAQATATEAQTHLNTAVQSHNAGQHDVASAHITTATQLVRDAANTMIRATGGGTGSLRAAVGRADQADRYYTTANRLETTNKNVAQAIINTELDNPDQQKAARNELYKFLRWLKKSPTHTFAFEHIPTNYAETLNKFISVEDHEGARWYAERYLA